MISFGIAYTLISVVLCTVAIFIHVKTSSLSLPLSPVLTIITILLPIVSLLNASAHPHILSFSRSSSANRLRQIAPFVLQTLQALAATIIATLLFEGVIPSAGLDCILENEWMQRFRAHDGGTIRRIQDTLDCCGFNSVKDRAFPFPKGAPSTCAATYDRTVACKGPWREALQTNSGIDFAIVLAVGLLQIVSLLATTEDTSWWATWWSQRWRPRAVRHESNRPLLTASVGDEESVQHDRLGSRSYGGINGNESGPRVEPSPIREVNAWDESH